MILVIGMKTGNLTQAGAEQAVKVADQALQQINDNRSNLAATTNGLQAAINNLAVTQLNLEAFRSQIFDTDFAVESMILTKMKVLTKAQSFAAAQTGKINKNNIMNLLQG